MNIITDKELKELLLFKMKDDIEERKYEDKKRKKISKFQRLILTIYYNNHIPLDKTKLEKNIEHIFPFSCEWNDKIDINRMGNLDLIDEKIKD